MLLSFTILSSHSQSILKGRILDNTSSALAGAVIKIENSNLGTKSNEDGSYTLNIPSQGSYKITVSRLGFKAETSFIKAESGQTTVLDFTLQPSQQKVKEVKVRGVKSKSSETAALAEQKASTSVIEVMGAQEMSRKGASDASAAVTKMVGVSKQEGSNQIYIRGLGDRYNTTTLNGMFLPSDNPEFKNIALEYFPTEIIQSINVSKTYNNTLLGDFGGASIDIASKEHTGKSYINLGIKSGFNTQALSQWNYGSDMNYFGTVDNNERPNTSEGKFIERNWQPVVRTMPRLNNELHVDGGATHNFTEKTKLSVYGTLTTSNKFQYFEGINRILYNDEVGTFKDNAYKKSFNYSVNQTGMLNTVLQNSDKFKSKLNLLGFRTASNQVNEYEGFNDGISRDIYRRRMIHDISTMYIAQWLNDYNYSKNITFYFSGAFNFIENDQPNRLTTSLVKQNNKYEFLANNSGDHSSYYQNLQDNDYTINIGSKIKLLHDSASNTNKINLHLGYTYRLKERVFNQVDYIFRPVIASYPNITSDDIDDAFSLANYNSGRFTMEDENPRNGKIDNNTYSGDLTVHSPSFGIDFIPHDKIILNFGARIDLLDQNVNWNIVTTYPNRGKANYNDLKILPFINAKYLINENENVKMAFSKTYTLPQFKELAPFLYFDISNYNTRGNPYLYASDNYNLDIKYEWYPSRSELFSIGGFGKFIQNPINKVFEASAGADQMVFVNSGEQATIFGAELEVKKNLLNKMERADSGLKYSLTGGFNTSVLYSNQDLNNQKVKKENAGYTSSIFTKTNSAIQGASPLILNLDLTMRMKFKNYEPQGTLVFNYFFDRLYALGSQNNGEVFERGIPSLDFITKHTITNRFSMNANFRNILNPSIDRYQVTTNGSKVDISSFKRGIDISFGANYKF